MLTQLRNCVFLALFLALPVQAEGLWLPESVRENCAAASNQCQLCRIDEKGGITGCSTPGIACQPSVWRCVEKRNAAYPFQSKAKDRGRGYGCPNR